MPKKGENIFKRKDGRWEARYIKGHDVSGKQMYGYCYGKTYHEAKEKVTKAKTKIQVQTRKPTMQEQSRFSFFCDEWFVIRKSEVKESTYEKYKNILEKHIKPKLGDYMPEALDSRLIETFKQELLDSDGLSPKTVKDIMQVLRSVMTYTANQLPGLLPMPEFHYPKPDQKERRVLSIDEQQRLTCYLLSDMDYCRFGILLALQTGLRLGELCALRWENVSIENRTIRICETIQRLKNTDEDDKPKTKLRVGNPKTGCSCRIIPMSDSVVGLCSKVKQKNPAAYILTGTKKPMDPRTLQYRLGKYTLACGIEGVHFHTLRHSFATRCVEADFELKSLSEILGHASPQITLERYVHSSMELKRSNMNKLATLNI